jgi:hypothetical protein
MGISSYVCTSFTLTLLGRLLGRLARVCTSGFFETFTIGSLPLFLAFFAREVDALVWN